MNHIPTGILAAASAPTTRRALAKMRTREALIAAAKALFTRNGYEDATVRDIAQAAGMSTGAVFANFADKADLFQAVLAEDQRLVAEAMSQVAARETGAVKVVLLAIFTTAYAFHLNQLPLMQATQSESWRQSPRQAASERVRLRQTSAMVEGVLYKGVANSELRSGIDVELAADLIWQAYQSNYRLAIYEGFGLEDLTVRLGRQLDMILPSLTA